MAILKHPLWLSELEHLSTMWALEIVHYAPTWSFFVCFCGVSLLCIHFLLLSKNSSGLLLAVCTLYLCCSLLRRALFHHQQTPQPPWTLISPCSTHCYVCIPLLYFCSLDTGLRQETTQSQDSPCLSLSLRDLRTAMPSEFNIWEQLLHVFANLSFHGRRLSPIFVTPSWLEVELFKC